MPLIKNAVTRYYFINECLSNPRKPYWSLEEIMEKAEQRDIGVSNRTFELDIQAMRHDERLRDAQKDVNRYGWMNEFHEFTNDEIISVKFAP